jgi:hypothetical protein
MEEYLHFCSISAKIEQNLFFASQVLKQVHFSYGLVKVPFLQRYVDIEMKNGSWSANSVETGHTIWMCSPARLYTRGKGSSFSDISS